MGCGLDEMHEAALRQQPAHTSLHQHCPAWVTQGQQGPAWATQGDRSVSVTGHYIASGHTPIDVFTSLSVVFKMLITATKLLILFSTRHPQIETLDLHRLFPAVRNEQPAASHWAAIHTPPKYLLYKLSSLSSLGSLKSISSLLNILPCV